MDREVVLRSKSFLECSDIPPVGSRVGTLQIPEHLPRFLRRHHLFRRQLLRVLYAHVVGSRRRGRTQLKTKFWVLIVLDNAREKHASRKEDKCDALCTQDCRMCMCRCRYWMEPVVVEGRVMLKSNEHPVGEPNLEISLKPTQSQLCKHFRSLLSGRVTDDWLEIRYSS